MATAKPNYYALMALDGQKGIAMKPGSNGRYLFRLLENGKAHGPIHQAVHADLTFSAWHLAHKKKGLELTTQRLGDNIAVTYRGEHWATILSGQWSTLLSLVNNIRRGEYAYSYAPSVYECARVTLVVVKPPRAEGA